MSWSGFRFRHERGTSAPELRDGGKGAILIVEDHLETQAVVAEYLSQEGFAVMLAADGESAFAQIRENRPILVYLDMNLPHISGYEVCERIRAEPSLSDVAILMTSAQTSRQVEAFCLEAGADAFLPKPFDLDNLATTIRRLISWRLSQVPA